MAKLSTEQKIARLNARLQKLSDRRENNVNRYIIPIEIKMSDLNDKIDELKKKI